MGILYKIIEKYKVMIKTRFAPSPTGKLHIGNIRAALIPFLFARHHHGHFMLRIDDTDQERSTAEFEAAIRADLAWLNLDYDSTAKQSERFARYQQVLDHLIEAGHVYPCFETPEELEIKRKRQMAKGMPPLYDRGALSLSSDQIQAYKDSGRTPHYRFKLTPTSIKWHDLIRKDVAFEGNVLSDPVLMRADGVFLYTFASVVDDIDFNITHIIRGEDHVSNTAVQIQLIEAILGAPCPLTFAHFTLFLDKNGQPLSKRLGSLSIDSIRDQGISPMAIHSVLGRLGTALPIEPFMTLEPLIRQFDFASFSRTSPHFDENELLIIDHKLLTMTPFHAIQHKLPDTLVGGMTENLWNLIRGNITTLTDCDQWLHIMGDDFIPPQNDAIDLDYIKQALDCLPESTCTLDTWSQWTNVLKEKTNRKGKLLYMPLRQVLTGCDHGPEMKEIIVLLGREKVAKRLSSLANI